MSQEIVRTKSKDLTDLIKSSVKELEKVLPSHLSAERMARIALTCIRLNPELAKCSPASFMGSLFVLAQIGLEPIAGRSYLLPFENSKRINNEWVKVKEVQALIGYKGYVELFYRHESALSIDMQTVRENDEFEYEYGTESFIKHKPVSKNRGEVTYYYAVAKMKGGASAFKVMSKEDAMAHGKKHSKTYNTKEKKFLDFSPWSKDSDAMCMKTVLIQLSKIIPLSVELRRAIEIDETSRDFREGIGDALDLPVTTNWNETDGDPLKISGKPEVDLPKSKSDVINPAEEIINEKTAWEEEEKNAKAPAKS